MNQETNAQQEIQESEEAAGASGASTTKLSKKKKQHEANGVVANGSATGNGSLKSVSNVKRSNTKQDWKNVIEEVWSKQV